MEYLGCKENDPSIRFGKFLANPPSGEEVVITGISGKFPDSSDVHHFRDNLFNKVDMVSGDSRRWRSFHPEIPQRSGKLLNLKKFDSGFFGIDYKQCDDLDPILRLVLETTAEAMFDAGYQPADFENTRTGVFQADVLHESESYFASQMRPGFNVITGVTKSMTPHRISYYFKLKGPSFAADTACSSALYALEHAYIAIRKGQCDKAIVAGCNLCLHPYMTLQFARLGVLSKDGRCRSFDSGAKGYARSETACVMILEKAKDSKRIYAEIVHSKTNSDGFKPEGITYPSEPDQITLLKELYTECGIHPSELSYLEAHATGTIAGDSVEYRAISEVLLKHRNTPLLVGSVKSNIGHAEVASGLSSIVKVILAYETRYIPPNINFKSFGSHMPGASNGKLVVVTEKTPFNDDKGLVGVSNFGVGGANCHILLKQHNKIKSQNIVSKEIIPRLIYVSGRTAESVKVLLDDVLENNLDVDHIRLLQNSFRKDIPGHLYRGYSLITNGVELKQSIKLYSHIKQPVYIAFGNVNSPFIKLGKELQIIPQFAKAFHRIQNTVTGKAVNIYNYLDDPNLYSTLGLAIQIGLIDLLKELEIYPTIVFGESIGEIASAYHNGALTLKDVLNYAYFVNQSRHDINCVRHKKNFFDKRVKEIDQYNATIEMENYFQELSNLLIRGLNKTESKSFSNLELNQKGVILEFGEPILSIQKRGLEIISVNTDENILNVFFECIGRLYQLGHDVQLHKIYPEVKFPVSRGTPMISPKIGWNHLRDYYVVDFGIVEQSSTKEKMVFRISLTEEQWSYLDGHVVDGRNLFPGIGYLYLAWEALANAKALSPFDISVRFENVKFKNATTLPKREDTHLLNLMVILYRASNRFEVLEGDTILAAGVMRSVETSKKYILAPVQSQTYTIKGKQKILDQNDIYKELTLKGYQYKGFFKSLKEFSLSNNTAKITWHKNFVAFIDTMLQIASLLKDTRFAYVPTSLKSLHIDAPAHLDYVNKLSKDQNELNIETDIPVHFCRELNLIRSGFIEIIGVNASHVNRKKMVGKPVLETYQFIPNEDMLTLAKALRVNLQIILENLWSIKNKIVELIDDEITSEEPLSILIRNALDDQPLVQSELKILSKNQLDIDVEVDDGLLEQENDCTLVVGTNLLGRQGVLNKAFKSVKKGGYVISREPLLMKSISLHFEHLTILTVYSTDQENIVLLREKQELTTNPKYINISLKNKDFNWLANLQEAAKHSPNVIAYTQNEPLSGIIGLVNCVRREPGCGHIRCVFIIGESPPFNPNNEFYKKQLQKNMSINIYKDGVWGTYRHLLLENRVTVVKSEHCFVNNTIKGDLSSLTLLEGPLTHDYGVDSTVISIYYSSLNFKDIMIASGRIDIDVMSQNRLEQECLLGMEFSGRDIKTGKRMMGLRNRMAVATLIETDPNMVWEVPEKWTLEEAATVPIVYSTLIYGLHFIGRVKALDSVLIHSGTGGVGQAAINICLGLGCKVFVTVGTKEKRDFIKKHFPKIKDNHIGSSRGLSFEQMIKKQTNGRGVDIVLNSLSEEKLFASVRCLAQGGRFIEIGKFDLSIDSSLKLDILNRGLSFHGVMFDKVCSETVSLRKQVFDIMREGIQNGVIKPIKRTVFPIEQVEKAFRFMGTGNHIGKVLLKIFFKKDKSYVICGGLGGFGLELADWLVLRGAKNIVLSSRRGISTGYQSRKIQLWRSYGCTIKVSIENITTKDGCETLIREACKLGTVEGIFNLAVILQDAVLENQTEESFQTSFGPKAFATEYLDEISRRLCPELKDFVVFSSVSCGRGNGGQTNYGMANSIMERICEKRRNDGLPALAIQWGTIAEVGLVAQMQKDDCAIEIGGTLQQSIDNCLQVLEVFLRQQTNVIVSSMVVAEKRIGLSNNIVEVIAKIMGLKDLKAISMYSTLAELGMDSMSAVEIKQTLEREYDITLNTNDIKSITFARLQEIQDSKDIIQTTEAKQLEAYQKSLGLDMLVRFFGDEATADIPILKLPSKSGSLEVANRPHPKILMLPGIEGGPTDLKLLSAQLDADIYCIQYCNHEQQDTLQEMANAVFKHALGVFSMSEPFHLVCHSYGFLVGIELVRILEELGYHGTITSIDASPDYMKQFLKVLNVETDESIINAPITQVLKLILPANVVEKHTKTILEYPTLELKIQAFMEIVRLETKYSPEYQVNAILASIKRIKSVRDYAPETEKKIVSSVTLIKPTVASFVSEEKDYGLSKLFTKVNVCTFKGNHLTLLENQEVANQIMLTINQCR